MKILHFSDPHAGGGAGSWEAFFDKRIVGIFNYNLRRRFKFNLKRVSEMVEYVMANPVDVIVCTGDLTSAGQPDEFNKMREILKPLLDLSAPVIYTPGNHDCYVKNADCVKAMEDMVNFLSRGEYNFSDMPFVRTIADCDFVAVNSSYPCNLLCSWGKVAAHDVRWVETLCNEPKKRPRILVGHFPLYEDRPVLRMRHRLFGQERLIELLENGNLDLSLCGHIHHPQDSVDGRGRGESIAGSISANGVASLINYDVLADKFTFEKLHFGC